MSENTPMIDAEAAQALIDRALGDPRQEFGSFFLSRLLGLDISYEGDCCIVAFDPHGAFFNPQSSLHGGIVATVLDISMGHLLNHVEATATTLEMKVQYLAPIVSGRVRCEASFLRQGRSVSFLQSSVYRTDGTLCAYATATWKALRKP